MGDQPKKVERALSAMRADAWSDSQHRRGAKRLEDALTAPKRRAVRPWIWSLAAAACVLGLFVVLRPWRHAVVAVGSTLGSEAEATSAIFVDGSEVTVDPGGQVRVVEDRGDETRVEVVRGRAEFEVEKRPGRPFITSARGVEVRVVGTHFSTEVDMSRPPGLVRVLVRRGIVEVRGHAGDPPSRLVAHESLEVPLGPTAVEAPAAPPIAPENTAAPSSASAVTPTSAPLPLAPPDASKLFEAAKTARSAGDVDAAVRSYALLVKQFPNDERAGVAALELGRLRMDSQHAYGPAADAFRRAIAKAPNEGVREDALARLVEALDAMNDHDTCLQERGRYLQRYPKGVHASSVENRCKRP